MLVFQQVFQFQAVPAFQSSPSCQPSWEKRGKGLTVSVLLDRSQSIPVPLKRSSVQFLAQAAELKERREDRVAVVTIARDANITAMADSYSAVTVGSF